jgi:cellulose synthase/poly-beta-1,6-N-acetylglucosamine synthase-like glycosyltransferase
MHWPLFIAEVTLSAGLLALGALSLNLVVLCLARLLAPRRRLATWLPADADLPDVLVQIPLYNEGELVARILPYLTALDWPRARLHIQILDDSTDGSLATSKAAVAALAADGWSISLHHRAQRTWFKAGALAAGLAEAQAQFVAIFDADFLPPPDFLRRTLSVLMADQELAYVQTRWLHGNQGHSLLTRAQARLLDGHFRVEQEARHRLGLPVPFNGTGGVWRRAAIAAAGGWHTDTLTEDLDLSLRARLAGWRSAYLPDLGVPGMLPESPRAWRVQQFRWTKGFIECLVKLAPTLWRSPDLPRWQKVMVTLQLAQPLAFLIGCVAILSSLPFIAGAAIPGPMLSSIAIGVGCGGLLGPMALIALGAPGASAKEVAKQGAAALLLTSGLLLSNARAALEALLGWRSEFVRTPKSITAPRAGLRRGGLPEFGAGAGLLVFALLEQPFALPPLGLVIGGLIGFGVMQLGESWPRLGSALTSLAR